MELDEAVEREKLVSEEEDDDPSPLEIVPHVPAKAKGAKYKRFTNVLCDW